MSDSTFKWPNHFPFRVGLGDDLHRLVEGRPLWIGGLRIPFDQGLLGHSDADVLCHALADALLGAAGLGDIGELFPDTDAQYEGIGGLDLLGQVVQRIHRSGWRVHNVDLIVHAQRPKLAPYKFAIRERLAACLGIGTSQLNLKAKTGEMVGPIGRGEAISASAVVLIIADPGLSDESSWSP